MEEDQRSWSIFFTVWIGNSGGATLAFGGVTFTYVRVKVVVKV